MTSKPRRKADRGPTWAPHHGPGVASPWALSSVPQASSCPPPFHFFDKSQKMRWYKIKLNLICVRSVKLKIMQRGDSCIVVSNINERGLLSNPIKQCKTTKEPHISCIYHKMSYLIYKSSWIHFTCIRNYHQSERSILLQKVSQVWILKKSL
jgi:hypothetical protein